jgi:DNA-binding IclR family transcriptional regulator
MSPTTVRAAPRADRNRSLERGIEVLRAFRPGTGLLGNGELAERTGLSRPTVTRLCQTLVDSGFLERDRSARAYRLAAPVLSLAHAMRTGSPVLAAAAPLMRAEAEKRRINVGLAVADRDEMVYLESVRSSRRVSWRNVVAGQRVPIELTSLGRAWLAAAPQAQRAALFRHFRDARGAREWKRLERELQDAIRDTRELGYCWASWQPEVVALATPFRVGESAVYVLNMSVSGSEPAPAVVERLAAPLLALAPRLSAVLATPRG